jgi:hypothetical protein
MNPQDPIVHEQLSHLVIQGRKAVVADVAILIVKGYDPEAKASVVMLVSDIKDESNDDAHEMALIIDALFKGIDNLLKATAKDVEIVIRDRKTGKEFDLNEGNFGHTVVKTEILRNG